MTPQVSVIMPSYNRQDLIGFSIESVQAQSMADWELLIIDDGSTDDTCRVAAGYAAQDPRIRLLQRTTQPKGPAACRNLGLFAAQAPRCLFLDSDDLLAPTCLAERLATAKQAPDVALHVFQMQFFYEHPGDTQELFFYADRADALQSSLLKGSPWGISCPFWRTDVLQKLGGFDESLQSWEDWDLHIRAFALGYVYEVHDTVDCYCRQGRVSLTSQHCSAAHLLQRTALYLKIGKLFEQQALPSVYKEFLASKCLAHCGMLREQGEAEAAQAAWLAFQRAGIVSDWQALVGKSYLYLRRTVVPNKEAWSTKLVRRGVAAITSKYLPWAY